MSVISFGVTAGEEPETQPPSSPDVPPVFWPPGETPPPSPDSALPESRTRSPQRALLPPQRVLPPPSAFPWPWIPGNTPDSDPRVPLPAPQPNPGRAMLRHLEDIARFSPYPLPEARAATTPAAAAAAHVPVQEPQSLGRYTAGWEHSHELAAAGDRLVGRDVFLWRDVGETLSHPGELPRTRWTCTAYDSVGHKHKVCALHNALARDPTNGAYANCCAATDCEKRVTIVTVGGL
jgi:hypothetical protein